MSEDAQPRSILESTWLQVVVAVLFLLCLAGMIAPRVSAKRDLTDGRARWASDIAEIRNALHRFRLTCDRYPTTNEGLKVLISGKGIKGWAGPYLGAIPRDPWRRSYFYAYLGEDEFEVYSLGADGEPGGEDGNEDIGREET
jgi:general secretion pathway protein G